MSALTRLEGLRALIVPCAAMLFMSAGGAAPPAGDPLQLELTPFLGYRLGGNFQRAETNSSASIDAHASIALALDLRLRETDQYELFYSRQATALAGGGFSPTAVKVEYLHIGGTVPLDDTSPVKPYLAGGLGVTRLTPDSALGHDDTRFSISLALGVRVPVNHSILLRLEGRGFLTPIATNSAVFCRSDESGALCTVRARGSVFFQFDVLAGIVFPF